MSREMYQHEYRDPYQLGDRVYFDWYGMRLRGEIVRTSSNPTYFHVEVEGKRYEVDLHNDNMRMEEDERSGG